MCVARAWHPAQAVLARATPPLSRSPDFNPVENVWGFLNKRLRDTDPSKLETV